MNPRSRAWWFALAVLVLAAIPIFYRPSYAISFATLVLFYVSLTCAWNILMFGGKLSLGHAAFFGLGGYAATVLYVKYGLSPFIGLLAAPAVALLGALLLSFPLVRLRGPFFTLASIAFAEVLLLVAVDWRSLTNGSVGLSIPFRPGWQNLTFRDNTPFYYIALVLAIGTIYVSYRIYNSTLGYHLRAAASDEEAAQALGVNIARVHVIALMWSAGITGLLGGFYAFFIYQIEPGTFFSLNLFSLQPALNGIIGGLGTIWGPVVGAALMTPLGEFLRSYLGSFQQGLNFFVYGLILILIVRILPGGIMSLFNRRPAPAARPSKDEP